MQLVPTQGDVMDLLRRTGALRDGHFACPSGFHTGQYLDTALVMRFHGHAKTLSIGLSRLLRANAELRAALPELSFVAATPSGLPVAYGLCEVLRGRQVYWAEKSSAAEPMRFPPFLEPAAGEKVILVDDVLRSGVLLSETRALLEGKGAEVVALAVLVHQPTPRTCGFGCLPHYSLARLDVDYYTGGDSCPMCEAGVPLERIGEQPVEQIMEAHALAAAF